MNRPILFRDKVYEGSIRVECLVEDGAMEVAIFCGPDAVTRAAHYAINHYDLMFDDPDGLIS